MTSLPLIELAVAAVIACWSFRRWRARRRRDALRLTRREIVEIERKVYSRGVE